MWERGWSENTDGHHACGKGQKMNRYPVGKGTVADVLRGARTLLVGGLALCAAFLTPLSASCASLPLCEEDEYIGITSGVYSNAGGEGSDKIIHYYDSVGNLAGAVLHGVDYYIPYDIIVKGRLIFTYDDAEQIVLSTDDFREIARFPREGIRRMSGAEHFAVYDMERRLLSCYDRNGKLLCLIRVENVPEGTVYPGELYEAEGYCCVELMGGAGPCFRAIFGDDGSCVTSEEPSFPAAFRGDIAASAGPYLIVSREIPTGAGDDETTTEYLVYNRDGTLVMDGFTGIEGYDPWLSCSFSQSRVKYLTRREEDGILVYDARLKLLGKVGTAYLSDWGNTRPAGGEIVGLPSEKLNGAIVDGAVTYHGKEAVYTRLDGGYLISTPEGFVLLAPPQGEVPEAVSAGLVLTFGAGEHIVRRRADMAELFRGTNRVTIQDDSYLVERDYEKEGDTYRIYDENGALLYESDMRICACPRGNYAIYRGPYLGIADRSGSWIVKELRYEE